MICPRCGNPVMSRNRQCDTCGYDMSIYEKVIHMSNLYYNRGLEKAKIRDLSGAVIMLRKSLEAYKKNIQARNLLGLIYFEMGETVAALSEWVISKNFQPNENKADYFINRIQNNPTKLDNLNLAVKKYNTALEAAKQGNDDLAIIQLKKVVSLNPNFLRAVHLIALLYMKNREYSRAAKLLQKISKIDIANTVTLRYLSEINRLTMGEKASAAPFWSNGSLPEDKPAREKALLPVSHYKEDKPNVMVFVNLLLGVLIGVAVVYYLIVPTIEQNIKEEYNSKRVDYSGELSAKSATITQLERSVENLEKKLETAQAKLDKQAETAPAVAQNKNRYNKLFAAISRYNALKAQADYTEEELMEVAYALYEVDTAGFDHKDATTLLEAMREEIYPLSSRMVYQSGKKLFDEKKYEEAEQALKAAVEFDKTADSPMYYLGKTYQAMEMYEEAAYYYRLMLEVVPNSTLKKYIPQRLGEMGMELEENQDE